MEGITSSRGHPPETETACYSLAASYPNPATQENGRRIFKTKFNRVTKIIHHGYFSIIIFAVLDSFLKKAMIHIYCYSLETKIDIFYRSAWLTASPLHRAR